MKKILMMFSLVFIVVAAYGDTPYTVDKTVSWWEQVTVKNVDLTGYKGQEMTLTGTGGITFLLDESPASFKDYTGSGSNYTVTLDTGKVTPGSSTEIPFVATGGPGKITLTVPPLVPIPTGYGKLKLIPTGELQPPATSEFNVQVGGYKQITGVKLNTELQNVPVGENMQIKITGSPEFEPVPSSNTVTINKGKTTDFNVSFKEAPPEGDYKIGTWLWINWNAEKPDNYKDYSVLMFGMITELDKLTTSNGVFGPSLTGVPSYVKSGFKGEVLWTYGGEFATPEGSPTSLQKVDAVIDATHDNNWDGIDIDDEFNGNTDNLVKVLQGIKNDGKSSSFTFLAGSDYTAGGTPVIDAKIVATKDYCDRYVLMCYGNAMWTDAEMKNFIPKAIKRTIDHGIAPKKIIVGACVDGLNATNLGYLINWVKGEEVIGESVTNPHELGGIFYWRSGGRDLPNDLFLQLKTGLGIRTQ